MNNSQAALLTLSDEELHRLEGLIISNAPNALMEELDLPKIVETMRKFPSRQEISGRGDLYAQDSGGRLYELTISEENLSSDEVTKQYERECVRANDLSKNGLSPADAWQRIRHDYRKGKK